MGGDGRMNRYWIKKATDGLKQCTSLAHPVAHLDPQGPAIQPDVLEILSYSLPKACICYSTKAEKTKGVAESLLDRTSQGNLTHPTTPVTHNSKILSRHLGSPGSSYQKNSSVENMLPIIPSSLLQHSLCTTASDELLGFPELHKGRGSCAENVGSWFSQKKRVRGSKNPTDQSVVSFH